MDPLLELLARDPEGLPSAAARHGLSGYALHLAEKEGLALPADAQRQLRHDARMIAGQSLRVKSVLLRALDALAKVGVIPVLLKGYGVGVRLYPDPLMRATSDVDLLVAPRDLDAASQALTSSGSRACRRRRRSGTGPSITTSTSAVRARSWSFISGRRLGSGRPSRRMTWSRVPPFRSSKDARSASSSRTTRWPIWRPTPRGICFSAWAGWWISSSSRMRIRSSIGRSSRRVPVSRGWRCRCSCRSRSRGTCWRCRFRPRSWTRSLRGCCGEWSRRGSSRRSGC